LRSARAFSSEVETGSRQENASNQKSRAPFRFYRNEALAPLAKIDPVVANLPFQAIVRRVSGINSQIIVRPSAATAASPVKVMALPNLSLT
jgi:hypothetical protein